MDNIAIQIDHEELIEFTKIYFKLKRPIFLWGTIGIGKCLEENTPILTDTGEKPIKELKAGDKVIGFNLKTQKIEKAEILNCFKKTGKFIEISIGENTIKSSAEHHFYTADGWKQAKDLKIGDTIYLYGEKQYPLSSEFIAVSITKINRENEAEAILRDITTSTGNYIASGILVHNSETIHYAGQQLADELNLKFETDIRQMDTEETFGFADIRISQLEIGRAHV